MIRGLSAVNYFVPDVTTAKKWYMELLGVLPHRESPDYVEFHIGASKHELALIDKKYEWKDVPASPSGAVVYWHTDDVEAFMEKLLTMGAKEHEPIRDFGGGYIGSICSRSLWKYPGHYVKPAISHVKSSSAGPAGFS